MPRRDGTGPMRCGSINGRGLGVCSGVNAFSLNRGNGCRGEKGFFTKNATLSKTQEEALLEENKIVETRLDRIKQQLEIK